MSFLPLPGVQTLPPGYGEARASACIFLWLLDDSHNDALALPFGETVGQPSRWNTLRALLVLRWHGQEAS